MFMVGARPSTKPLLQERIQSAPVILLLAVYLVVNQLSVSFGLGAGDGNHIDIVSFVALSMLILKLAFTKPALSARLLGRNDISYGVYIFHMPIVNFLLYHGAGPSALSVAAAAIAATVGVAWVSWRRRASRTAAQEDGAAARVSPPPRRARPETNSATANSAAAMPAIASARPKRSSGN